MPQRSYDFSGLPDQPDFEGPINQYDFSGLPDQEEPRKYDPNSWFDWTVNQGIRTLPMIAGGMFGGPAGAVGGAVAGSLGGNWWEGRPFNPYETAVEGGLALLPGFGEAPGAGATARQILKYAAQSAGTGAVQGLAGSVPRHIAETGKWELPSAGEAASQTLGGAGFGAIMGAGHGLWAAHTPSPTPTTEPQYIHDMSHGNYEQSSFDLPGLNYPEHDPRQQLFPGMSPDDMKALREAPTPPSSPYGFGMGQQSQGMLDFNPPESPVPTSFEPSGQGSLFADPRAPQVRVNPPKIDPQIMDQMRNPNVPPPTPPTMPQGGNPNEMDDILKAIDDIINKKPAPKGSAPADDVVEFPTSTVTDEFKKNMTDGGYEVVGQKGRNTVFRKTDEITRGILESRDVSEMRGPDDNIIPDPNAESDLMPGEQPRGVAPFPAKATNLFEVTQGIKQNIDNPHAINGLIVRAKEIIDGYKTSSHTKTDYSELKSLADRTSNPDEAEIFQHIADLIKEKGNKLNQTETFGMGVPIKLKDLPPEAFPEDRPKHTWNDPNVVPPEHTAELQRQADLMRQLENPTYRKPRPTYPTDRPIPMKEGQLELPFSRGEADHPIDADARSREIQAIADRLKVPPGEILRQLNMEGQMKDAEIQKYLKKEDGTPPESRDIRMPNEVKDDLRVGESGFSGRNQSDIFKNSSTEQLKTLHDQLEQQLNILRRRTGEFSNNAEATGMAKRRVVFAETKLRALKEELNSRSESRGVSEAEGPTNFEEDWKTAINRAEEYGIDWRKYDDLNQLKNDTLREHIKKLVKASSPFKKGTRGPLQTWEARETDPPQIAAMRKELDGLTRKNEMETLKGSPVDDEGNVLSPKETARMDHLFDKLDEYDKFNDPNGRQTSHAGGPTRESGEEQIGMAIGDRKTMLRNMQGQYAETGARTASKELGQNALDALTKPDGTGVPGGKVDITVDHHPAGTTSGGSITVQDNGSGLSYEMIKNEYITLTGSGKRGKGKYIGEMGVGKATYLLGVDKFDITTTHRESNGEVWRYRIEGTPDTMIDETTKLTKQLMPKDTPTGTKAIVYDSNSGNISAAEDYLKTFHKYSNSPVEIESKGNQWLSLPQYNLNEKMTPGTPPTAKFVAAGTSKGGNFNITIPDNAKWNDAQGGLIAVLNNRGMFQGAEHLSLNGVGRLPDHIVVEIDPTVPATNGRDYPLTAPTRERMKADFRNDVVKVVNKEIMEAAKKNQQQNIQAAYDALVPQSNPSNPKINLPFVTNNRGGRYTQQELDHFNSSPTVQKIGTIMGRMLNALDKIFPTEQAGGKTTKYGFDLANQNAGGINIPNPTNKDENAILINLMGALHQAKGDPMIAAERIAHTILHEFNHNIVRNEGGDFTWSFINVDSKFGTQRRAGIAEVIRQVISGPDGKYAPEVQRLLQEHTTARGRQDSQIDYLARPAESGIVTATGPERIPVRSESNGEGTARDISHARSVGSGTTSPPDKSTFEKIKESTGWGQGASATGRHAKTDVNFVKEALAVPSAVTTGLDVSFPGRQGLTQVLTPEFWKAAYSMFKGFSPEAYKTMNDALKADPLFHDYIGPDGKLVKSLGTQAGIKIYDIASNAPMSKRAEGVASRWLEQGIGTGPIATGYKNTLGALFRMTNRGSVTFLNQLGANRFKTLVNAAEAMSLKALETGKAPMPGMLGGMNIPGLGHVGFNKSYNLKEALDINPHTNLVLAKEIADFVNTAIGHGPLKTHVLPFKQTEISLEGAADTLRTALFSPGLMASRVRLTNPSTYIMASPFVRKQYMKAAISTASAWFIFTEMAKLAGGEDVSVSNDITNADFGKVRIGDTRMDAGGGFLQFLTAYGRLYKGGSTSSSTGTFHKFGEGYQAQTQEDMFERFMVNKLNPVAKFAYDLGNASQYNPFHVGDRVMQMFVPLVLQDLKEITQENPHLIPWMAPVALGMGTQSYSKGESVGKLVNPENDWLVQGGGGLRSLMPWNMGEDQ